LPATAFKRIAKQKAGIKRISPKAIPEIEHVFRKYLDLLFSDAVFALEVAKMRTVTEKIAKSILEKRRL